MQPGRLVLYCCLASLVQGPYNPLSILDIFSLLPQAKENKMVFIFQVVFFPSPPAVEVLGLGLVFFPPSFWFILLEHLFPLLFLF